MRAGKCERCGAGFVDTTKPQNRRYCSDNCRKRASADRHRASCVDCGATLSAGSAWRCASPRDRCRSCHKKRLDAQVAEWAEPLVRLWAEGESMAAIAAELGFSMYTLGVQMDHARSKGYDLPYRYQLTQPRYEEMAA